GLVSLENHDGLHGQDPTRGSTHEMCSSEYDCGFARPFLDFPQRIARTRRRMKWRERRSSYATTAAKKSRRVAARGCGSITQMTSAARSRPNSMTDGQTT